jgi:hypothetical protein
MGLTRKQGGNMKKQLLGAASLLLIGVAAGCGSSSDGNVASSGSVISGKVADGYLQGATVFLDKNKDYKLDAGEPFTTTDQSGAYTLNVDPADVGRYHIFALATAGVTIDSDNPGQPIANSYLLSLHRLNVNGTVNSNFISPISTQLREMMETGKFATMHEAMEALRGKLGIPAGSDMMSDYIAGGNQRMHLAAQDMATLMGGQMPHVFGSNGSTSVDVNRYRGMMGMIFGNISSVRAGSMTMGSLSTAMQTRMGSVTPGLPYLNMSSMYRSGSMTGGGMTGGGMTGGGMTGGGMTGGGMMGGNDGKYQQGDAGEFPR